MVKYLLPSWWQSDFFTWSLSKKSFKAKVPFIYNRKNQKTKSFSDVFNVNRKGTLVWNESNFTSPAVIYLLKVNNRSTWTRCEICSKLTIKTPGRQQKLPSCRNKVNWLVEQINWMVSIWWQLLTSFWCLYC